MHFENLHFNRCLLQFWHAIQDQNFDTKKRKKVLPLITLERRVSCVLSECYSQEWVTSCLLNSDTNTFTMPNTSKTFSFHLNVFINRMK